MTVGVAAVLSAGIETVQYFIGRSADIDDLLLNLFGTVLGFGLYAILRKWLQRIEWFILNPRRKPGDFCAVLSKINRSSVCPRGVLHDREGRCLCNLCNKL